MTPDSDFPSVSNSFGVTFCTDPQVSYIVRRALQCQIRHKMLSKCVF